MSTPFSPVQVNDVALQRGLDEDTRRTTALIDGATGLVLEDGPHRIKSSAQGFGPTVQLLEIEPFRLAPWLTPELCEQELAMSGTKGS
jgi:hypothetical protein